MTTNTHAMLKQRSSSTNKLVGTNNNNSSKKRPQRHPLPRPLSIQTKDFEQQRQAHQPPLAPMSASHARIAAKKPIAVDYPLSATNLRLPKTKPPARAPSEPPTPTASLRSFNMPSDETMREWSASADDMISEENPEDFDNIEETDQDAALTPKSAARLSRRLSSQYSHGTATASQKRRSLQREENGAARLPALEEIDNIDSNTESDDGDNDDYDQEAMLLEYQRQQRRNSSKSNNTGARIHHHSSRSYTIQDDYASIVADEAYDAYYYDDDNNEEYQQDDIGTDIKRRSREERSDPVATSNSMSSIVTNRTTTNRTEGGLIGILAEVLAFPAVLLYVLIIAKLFFGASRRREDISDTGSRF